MKTFKLAVVMPLVVLMLGVFILSSGCVEGELEATDPELRAEVEVMKQTIADQAELIANIPAYAEIREMDKNSIKISVHGEGNYPVIITFYGVGLIQNEITETQDHFIISREYGAYSVMVVVLEPIKSWLERDTIELSLASANASGNIDYASVAIGNDG